MNQNALVDPNQELQIRLGAALMVVAVFLGVAAVHLPAEFGWSAPVLCGALAMVVALSGLLTLDGELLPLAVSLELAPTVTSRRRRPKQVDRRCRSERRTGERRRRDNDKFGAILLNWGIVDRRLSDRRGDERRTLH